MSRRHLLPVLTIFMISAGSPVQVSCKDAEKPAPKPQYELENGTTIPAASATEPIRKEFSTALAADYLQTGAISWTRNRKCVSCHTNGAYLQLRPGLTKELGPPSEEIRTFAIGAMRQLKEEAKKASPSGILPTQVAYIAAGLAEWDVHVTGTLSAETREALEILFGVQSDDGSFRNSNCWPPYESSDYHGTAIAAMAAAAAPGWLENLEDEKLTSRVKKMTDYLRTEKPPHDFGRLLLLWTATKMPDLIDAEKKKELIEVIWKQQREDGGWSLRTFAAPEAWGKGNRAERLRSDPDFKNPSSDGHQTGLAVVVLRDAGVPADDPRIQKAVRWLLTHQRASGRWWTRSLNRDNMHYITFSGSAYPLLALARCDALPPLGPKTAAK